MPSDLGPVDTSFIDKFTSLSPEDREELKRGYLDSMAKYDAYLERWAAAIRQHIAEQDAERAEKQRRFTHAKRRASNTAKPARKQSKSARKKGKDHA